VKLRKIPNLSIPVEMCITVSAFLIINHFASLRIPAREVGNRIMLHYHSPNPQRGAAGRGPGRTAAPRSALRAVRLVWRPPIAFTRRSIDPRSSAGTGLGGGVGGGALRGQMFAVDAGWIPQGGSNCLSN